MTTALIAYFVLPRPRRVISSSLHQGIGRRIWTAPDTGMFNDQ